MYNGGKKGERVEICRFSLWTLIKLFPLFRLRLHAQWEEGRGKKKQSDVLGTLPPRVRADYRESVATRCNLFPANSDVQLYIFLWESCFSLRSISGMRHVPRLQQGGRGVTVCIWLVELRNRLWGSSSSSGEMGGRERENKGTAGAGISGNSLCGLRKAKNKR